MPNIQLSVFSFQSSVKQKNKSDDRRLMTDDSFGFTLIELIVAIAIVAIIAAIGFTSYSQSQVVARDSKRKQDLQAIQSALQLYYQDNNRYPQTVGWVLSTQGQPWIKDSNAALKHLSANYINPLPTDPTNVCAAGDPGNTTSCRAYGYWSDARSCGSSSITAGQAYVLAASLENDKDPERISNLSPVKNKYWCNGKELLYGPSLFLNNNPNVYAITSE